MNGDVEAAANPDFPQVCGVDVLIVIDNSFSVGAPGLQDVKDAANDTVDVLSTTDDVSSVGVISFNSLLGVADDGADTRIAMTLLDSQADVDAVKDAIGTIRTPDDESLTNWEAPLLESSLSENDQDGDVADENLNKPADLVIFLSDGRPNVYGYDNGEAFDDAGTAFNEPLEAATFAANVVKGEETRIVGIGFPDGLGGNPQAGPFQQITGSIGPATVADVVLTDVRDTDYYLVDDTADVSGVMTAIASEFDCDLVVEKLNDANDDAAFTDDETAPAPGDAVTYQVEVSNPGSIDLVIDSYVDDVYGAPVVSPDLIGETLAAGDSIVVTFQGTAPDENGVKVNTFEVTASDEDGFELTDDDPTTVRSPDLTPSIVVEKLNDADDDAVFTDDETSASPGDAVTYEVTVTNNGPNTVTIDSYTDDIYGSPALSAALVGETLAPGESIVVTFQGTTPATEDTAKTNTFSVTASDGDGDEATDDDPTTVRSPDLAPSIDVQKLNDADDDGAFTDDETSANPGDAVTYEVTVTNDGPNTVTITSFSDDIYGAPAVNPALVGTVLAPGESIVVTFQGSTPATEGTAKTNTFEVTASDDDGDEASDDDPTTVRSPDLTPSIDVQKLNDADDDGAFTDDETSANPGDAVTYEVTVTNDGPNTVTIDSYTDDIYGSPALSAALVGETLAPGESIVVTFQGSTPATEDTAKTNTFSVTASDEDGDEATDDDPTTVRSPDLTPSIVVEKLVDADGDGVFADSEEADNPGDAVTYEVTVTNDGPNAVELTAYSDDIYGAPALSGALVGVVLGPGESLTVTFDGTAPLAFDDSKTNVFTVDGQDGDGDPVSDSDDATVTTGPRPEEVCPRTPGFWKTHGFEARGNNDDLVTPLLPVTLGDGSGKSVVVSDAETADMIFSADLTDDSANNNGISRLYIHLLAAKLNTANGAFVPADVQDAIMESDAILAQYDESDWDSLSKDQQQEINDLKDLLDQFNNRAFASEDCIEDFWKENGGEE